MHVYTYGVINEPDDIMTTPIDLYFGTDFVTVDMKKQKDYKDITKGVVDYAKQYIAKYIQHYLMTKLNTRIKLGCLVNHLM